VTRGPWAQPDRALELYKKVVAIDPAQPTALRVLGDALASAENWQALVMLYAARSRCAAATATSGCCCRSG
jgi:hypothetical protein